ncbi:MAG TPA: hypothetical protein VJ781_11185 [Pyrinomonadaceae bacterium]|nr:hypothetical protein [Pyrinomonadaceae bacterium]
MSFVLFDIGPPGGSIGFGLMIGGFLVLAAIAYVIFRLLRKTVRIALRLAIVAAILIIGLIGGAFFLMLGSGSGPVQRPATQRNR